MKNLKHELQHILRGEGQVSGGTLIQAIARYLRASQTTSGVAQSSEYYKAEEKRQLADYINSMHLWNCDIPFNAFVSAGAEQRVYIQDNRRVQKLNDFLYQTRNIFLKSFFAQVLRTFAP